MCAEPPADCIEAYPLPRPPLAPAPHTDANGNDDWGDASAPPDKFVLNGQTLRLPGLTEQDTLPNRVEALRVYLESELGTDTFVKVYRLMNDLQSGDDDALTEREIALALGPERMPVLSLVNQLLVCEDSMCTANTTAH